MEPLQGFWNVLIFLYNRPQSREKLAQSVRSLSSRFLPTTEDSAHSSILGNPKIKTRSSSTRRSNEHSATDRTSSSCHHIVETESGNRQVSFRLDPAAENLSVPPEAQSPIVDDQEPSSTPVVEEEPCEHDDALPCDEQESKN